LQKSKIGRPGESREMRGGQLEKGTARRTELMVAGMSDLPQ